MEKLPLLLLNYRLIGVSSEEPQHPLKSIISKTPSEGWNSVRFCYYPQEILIQFPQPVRLRQLNLLFHQTKIPSKVYIFHFFPKNNSEYFLEHNSLNFNKIGYVIPDTNKKTNYKARELKKVFLNENCLYIKLMFYKNHYNILNPFSQVGLISLECYGIPFTHENIDILFPNRDKSLNYFGGKLEQYVPVPEIDDSEIDEICLSKIEQIRPQLNKAILEENYDNAKIFNESIQRIKLLALKIKNYTDIKLKAIEVGDYINAKKVKKEIEKIRNIVESFSDNELEGTQQFEKVVLPKERNEVEIEEQKEEKKSEDIKKESEEENASGGTESQQRERVQESQNENISNSQGISKSEEIQKKLKEKKRLIKESKDKAKSNLLMDKIE